MLRKAGPESHPVLARATDAGAVAMWDAAAAALKLGLCAAAGREATPGMTKKTARSALWSRAKVLGDLVILYQCKVWNPFIEISYPLTQQHIDLWASKYSATLVVDVVGVAVQPAGSSGSSYSGSYSSSYSGSYSYSGSHSGSASSGSCSCSTDTSCMSMSI